MLINQGQQKTLLSHVIIQIHLTCLNEVCEKYQYICGIPHTDVTQNLLHHAPTSRLLLLYSAIRHHLLVSTPHQLRFLFPAE